MYVVRLFRNIVNQKQIKTQSKKSVNNFAKTTLVIDRFFYCVKIIRNMFKLRGYKNET